MTVTFYDSLEEMFEAIDEARRTADARVTPGQAALGVGDHFANPCLLDEGLLIVGKIIESPYPEDQALYREPHMWHYRLTHCWSEACPEGEIGDTHVSQMIPIAKAQFLSLLRTITGKEADTDVMEEEE